MTDKEESIFIKRSDVPKHERKLSKGHLLSVLKNGVMTKPSKELAKDRTEWRWRFYKINDQDLIEISYKKIGSNRMYINKFGDWVERDIGSEYDAYIAEEYYDYTLD